VRGIRKRMKLSQSEFGYEIGVSEITIRRWENAHAVSPNRYHMARLKELSVVCSKMKKSGNEFEPHPRTGG
jgi:DNA-binding transcriptional regulator YiaG